MTETDGEEVAQARAVDVAYFTNLSAYVEKSHDVHDGDEIDAAADKATIAHVLGVLAEGVTRAEVGDETKPAVVETAAESVLPLGHPEQRGVCRSDFKVFCGKRVSCSCRLEG